MSVFDKLLAVCSTASGFILFLASQCDFYKNNTVKQIFCDGAADHGKQVYFSGKQGYSERSWWVKEKRWDEEKSLFSDIYDLVAFKLESLWPGRDLYQGENLSKLMKCKILCLIYKNHKVLEWFLTAFSSCSCSAHYHYNSMWLNH